MKPRMMSKPAMDHLFHHVLGGHESSHKSIEMARQSGLISDEEMTALFKKNSDRLIDRINEFKIVHKLVCIFFAMLFGYMQVTFDDDIDMRRTSSRIRVRSQRSQRSRNSKRKGEGDIILNW